jgi:hypothetical protein
LIGNVACHSCTRLWIAENCHDESTIRRALSSRPNIFDNKDKLLTRRKQL